MANLRRPLVITFLSGSGSTVVNLLVSIVLARMLTPSEIGVFSITYVFVNIAHIFRDFGVAAYLEREPELTRERIRAAMGVLYSSSWLIALVLFIASGWISAYFNQEKIKPVMQVLALGFVFAPLGAVTHAMLVRQYAADKQAIVNAVGTFCYAASCLTFAAFGFGTMSLAWANLINIISTAIAFIPFRTKDLPWIPSLRNWGEILHFSVGSLITNCINAINDALPDMLLGKLGDAHRVGLFSRANSTVNIFSYIAGATINYGALRYISTSHHKGESIAPILSKNIALLTGIGWPALALTTVLGSEIVLTLYGQQWVFCVSAIPALALAAAVNMMFNYNPIALTAIGKPYLSAIPIAVMAIMRISLALAFFSASIESFSWVICLATVLAAPAMLFLQTKLLQYPARDLLKAVLPSAVVSVICWVAGYLLLPLVPGGLPHLVTLLLLAPFLAAIWYVSLRLLRHPLVHELHAIANGVRTRIQGLFA